MIELELEEQISKVYCKGCDLEDNPQDESGEYVCGGECFEREEVAERIMKVNKVLEQHINNYLSEFLKKEEVHEYLRSNQGFEKLEESIKNSFMEVKN